MASVVIVSGPDGEPVVTQGVRWMSDVGSSHRRMSGSSWIDTQLSGAWKPKDPWPERIERMLSYGK